MPQIELTHRDWLAGQALPAMIAIAAKDSRLSEAKASNEDVSHAVAVLSYMAADAMLTVRDQ